MKVKNIWNIVLQSWDRNGQENHYSIDSFTHQDEAMVTFNKRMEEDKDKQGFEKTPDANEYYYDYEDGGFARVIVLESKLY